MTDHYWAGQGNFRKRAREWYPLYRVNWFVRDEITAFQTDRQKCNRRRSESPGAAPRITPRRYYNCSWRSGGEIAPVQLLRLSFAAVKIYGTVDAPRRGEVEGRRPRWTPAITRDSRNRKTKRTPSALRARAMSLPRGVFLCAEPLHRRGKSAVNQPTYRYNVRARDKAEKKERSLFLRKCILRLCGMQFTRKLSLSTEV